MMRRFLSIAASTAALIPLALAQNPSPPAGTPGLSLFGPTPAANPDAAVAEGQDTATGATDQAEAAQQQTQQPGFLGRELPFLDPGSEVVAWDGHSWNIANNRIFGARFEKYLSSPTAETEEDQAYRQTLRDILDALSPHQKGKANLTKAVALLPVAASYYHDARLCESLSNTIYGVWMARRNVAQLQRTNQELDRQVRAQLHNANVAAERNRLNEGPRQVGGNGSRSNNGNQGNGNQSNGNNNNGGDPNNNVNNGTNNNGNNGNNTSGLNGLGGLLGTGGGAALGSEDNRNSAQDSFRSVSYTSYYLKKVAEYETLIAQNRLEAFASEIQQKIEFQGLILQFFLQRRFEHVVIATRIYRQLFQDGDNTMQFDENSQVAKSFKVGIGMSPTITTFDTLANEAIRDVDEGVLAFEQLLEHDELEGATKRLSEAFAVGEYLPRIRTLEFSKKRKILSFVRNANQLLSALEVKDYKLAGELVEKMKLEAKDFDYSKAQAAINTYTMTADMYLKQAMLAARNNDTEEVQKNLQKAHELYPTNPELKRVSDLIMHGSDTQSQALNDLDRLIAEGNYRAIQKEEARFAAAVGLSNDPKRLEDLMKIREELRNLEGRMEKARALSDAGSPEAAWETLREVHPQFKRDPEFAALYSTLTVKAATFVKMIEEADRHWENGQLGSSLAWYLQARRKYIKSDLAREGIQRVVNGLLPQKPSLTDGLSTSESEEASPAPQL